MEQFEKTEEQLKKELDPAVYAVTREKGTEPAFSGTYYKNTDDGTYHCAVCQYPLFSSDAKFDSGCGWPSFTSPAAQGHVELHEDLSHGMKRTEVTCAHCGSHLGHVFDDGPTEAGGKRYCINSLSLNLKTETE